MNNNLEEKLISAVFLRPFIYDKKNPSHYKKQILSNAWNEISQEVGVSVESCQKRWKSLRDTYFKKRPLQSRSGDGLDEIKVTWKWYDMMKFLGEYNEPKQTRGNLDVLNFVEEELDDSILVVSPSSFSDTQQSVDAEDVDSIPQAISNTSSSVKRPSIWYGGQSKGNRIEKKSKNSITDQWETVIEKCTKLVEVESATIGSKLNDKLNPFAIYISTEMDKLKEDDQDNFKFGVMDLLKKIKRKEGCM